MNSKRDIDNTIYKSSNEIENALEQEIFNNREQIRSHTRYLTELRFMNHVKNGQIEQMKSGLEHYNFDEVGRMSKNPYRQLLFLFISSVTLATRFAMEGGLLEEDSYHLSDIYIQKADLCSTVPELKIYIARCFWILRNGSTPYKMLLIILIPSNRQWIISFHIFTTLFHWKNLQKKLDFPKAI